MGKTIYYDANPYDLDQLEEVGQGGEGYIYRLAGENVALKIFKGWEYTGQIYANLDAEEKRHMDKLMEMQAKLRKIPFSVPDRVAKPLGLVFNEKKDLIVGFGMPYFGPPAIDGVSLVRFIKSKEFRKKFTPDMLVKVLLDLHKVVAALHERGIVIGDFTPDNVIIHLFSTFAHSYIVDFDSMQWNGFTCRASQWEWADPLLLKRKGDGVVLSGNFNEMSDWYSFTVISMQVLTMVGPYSGIIANKALKKWNLPTNEIRAVHRLNVFHPDVEYPVAAIPLNHFSPELVTHWRDAFQNDVRQVFPFQLLMQLKWQTCPKCHTTYASRKCPKLH